LLGRPPRAEGCAIYWHSTLRVKDVGAAETVPVSATLAGALTDSIACQAFSDKLAAVAAVALLH
jgi:hypothetical protein